MFLQYQPDIRQLISALLAVTHFNPQTTLRNTDNYHPHFSVEMQA